MIYKEVKLRCGVTLGITERGDILRVKVSGASVYASIVTDNRTTPRHFTLLIHRTNLPILKKLINELAQPKPSLLSRIKQIFS